MYRCALKMWRLYTITRANLNWAISSLFSPFMCIIRIEEGQRVKVAFLIRVEQVKEKKKKKKTGEKEMSLLCDFTLPRSRKREKKVESGLTGWWEKISVVCVRLALFRREKRRNLKKKKRNKSLERKEMSVIYFGYLASIADLCSCCWIVWWLYAEQLSTRFRQVCLLLR